MKKILYVFNPDTDLALADGSEFYLPPRTIAQLANDLRTLPFWYGEEAICIPDENLSAASEMPQHICPWGWNATLVRQLKAAGYPDSLLPGKQQLAAYRQLARRSTAIELLNSIAPQPIYCGTASELFSEEELEDFATQHSRLILKAPWSGSGKGLCFAKDGLTPSVISWFRKVCKQQGSVIAEVLYEKEADFALEFFADEQGNIRLEGYSLFLTDTKGAYQESLLAPNEAIHRHLSRYFPPDTLGCLERELLRLLPSILKKQYNGYFGIDMLIARFSTPPYYRLHPCVEINLRMNMGVVARKLADQALAPHSTGRFRILYHPQNESLAAQHRQLFDRYPLVRDLKGRIRSGYLALTPVTPHTHYLACLIASETNQSCISKP